MQNLGGGKILVGLMWVLRQQSEKGRAYEAIKQLGKGSALFPMVSQLKDTKAREIKLWMETCL